MKRNRTDHEDTSIRVLVSKEDVAKIIGRQGSMIAQLRAKSGANLKSVDVTDESRLVSISGTQRQVLECFDLVAEV